MHRATSAIEEIRTAAETKIGAVGVPAFPDLRDRNACEQLSANRVRAADEVEHPGGGRRGQRYVGQAASHGVQYLEIEASQFYRRRFGKREANPLTAFSAQVSELRLPRGRLENHARKIAAVQC